MHIAILVKDFPPDIIGGTETQTKRMAKALEDRGHDVTVFTKRYRNHDDSDVPFEIVRVPNLTFNTYLSTLSYLLVTAVLLARRADEFDVCQCMMIYPNGFIGCVISRLTGLPYFAWIRGGDYYFMKDIWWKRWMIALVLEDTRVLVQAPSIAADVREEFPNVNHDLEVLGNGIELPESTAEGDYVLYLGRLAPKKGVDVLLRAMDGLDTPVVIVGDGPERDNLEDLATKLDVNAQFVGEVSPGEVDRYYRNAAVYCLPSKKGEGLPNTVLEAMSWALPCVTTDSGGLPMLVGEDERGYIAPSEDVESIRNMILELLQNDKKRDQWGQNARKYVANNHSWEAIVSSLKEHYDYLRK